MKKIDKVHIIRVFKNRTRRNNRRKFCYRVVKERMACTTYSVYKIYQKAESTIVKSHDFKYLSSILSLCEWPKSTLSSNKITFPEICKFEIEQNQAEIIVSDLLYILTSKKYSKLILNFETTKKMSQEFAMLVSSIIHYFRMDERLLNKKLRQTRVNLKLEVIESKDKAVNKELFMMSLLKELTFDNKKEEMHPGYSTGIIINDSRKRDIFKNEKGRTAKKIVNLVNDSLKQHGFEMKREMESSMQLMISEILDNCEQHSTIKHYFCMANFMSQTLNPAINEKVGELNIVFMNLGYSFYEGFLRKRELNIDNYNEVKEFVKYINKDINLTKEELENQYVYGILQSGNSRLKYDDESRGNGTVNFIRQFSGLGDFEDINKEFVPELYILTGRTIVKVCNKNRPFIRNKLPFLPLHDKGETEWMAKTDKEFLRLGKNNIPGTILSARLYLNSDHILQKIKNNEGS